MAKRNPFATQLAGGMGPGPRSGSAMWQCDTDAEPEAPESVQMSYTLTGKELVGYWMAKPILLSMRGEM